MSQHSAESTPPIVEEEEASEVMETPSTTITTEDNMSRSEGAFSTVCYSWIHSCDRILAIFCDLVIIHVHKPYQAGNRPKGMIKARHHFGVVVRGKAASGHYCNGSWPGLGFRTGKCRHQQKKLKFTIWGFSLSISGLARNVLYRSSWIFQANIFCWHWN